MLLLTTQYLFEISNIIHLLFSLAEILALKTIGRNIEKTDEEISLICLTHDTPSHTTERDDGWKGFRIQGILDFSLIGILSKISKILAKNGNIRRFDL